MCLQKCTGTLVTLAFIPAEYVIEAFEPLSDDIEDALIPLFDYFEDTWIGRPGRHGIQRNPLFPIRMVNIPKSNLRPP